MHFFEINQIQLKHDEVTVGVDHLVEVTNLAKN